jgi:excisionase family DNA binding protein
MTTTPADARGYYSVSEAAALLGVSRVSLWRWIRAGQIPMARIGHRTTRISREDLEGVLLKRTQQQAHRRIRASRPEHVVQFYEQNGSLLQDVAELIGRSLREGGAGIVVATPEHLEALAARLRRDEIDLVQAELEGRFVALDAAETLAAFMGGGMPSADRFAAVMGPLVARAAEGGRRVRVFGEMVGLLAAQGNHAAAIRLEELWNELQTRHRFSLICGYPMAVFANESLAHALDGVCGEHSRVVPAESYTSLVTRDEQARSVAVLQQKARALEVEVALRESVEQQLRAALEAERAARAAAEAALNMRDEFLSVASHELKTPVTALSAYAQLALRRIQRHGHIDEDRVEKTLQTITGQADRLTRLLNQLLDISRLESGKLSLEPQLTDVRALVAQVLIAAEASTDRQHTFAWEAPSTLQARVDPLRLEQVLVNLVDNAVKYSPDGGRIELHLGQSTPALFEVSVRDHGLGIPPDKRDRIFERFYQAHGNTNRGGMGLGLYITRQIVELHGGSIRAEFPDDGGTRFVVSLPVGVEAWSSIESSSVSAA